MKCLGLMSGTSVDGVDCAIVQVSGSGQNLRIKLLGHQISPYRPSLRRRILLATEGGMVADLCHLNVLVGEIFAQAALRTIRRLGFSPKNITLIGSHGQTICHQPRPIREPGVGLIRSSLQIGDPSVIAERTGITTVADFRARDLAAGGEGAPLTPYVHYLMFRNRDRSRLIVNLGGIANVTYLPADGTLEEVLAFDTGPCNMLLDALVHHATEGKLVMDREGRLARRGTSLPRFLSGLMNHSFLRRKPPKSTGREEFGGAFAAQVFQDAKKQNMSTQDLLATSCEFIALTIAKARRWLPGEVDEVLVGGGGVRNRTFMKHLAQALYPIPMRTMAELGIDSKAFEALAFAVLAYQTFHRIEANLPAVTGARHPVVLGTIVPGRSSPRPLSH